MRKRILILNGHPDEARFATALHQAYKRGAERSGAEVRELFIRKLEFNPNLAYGYKKRMELEPDLKYAWDQILWAEHLVWIHPVWWGGLPALMKGFIDRLFLPGLAFRYIPNSLWWEKLLKGKSAHIISTMDQPGWFYRFYYGRPSVNQLKKVTLEFCGISPVKVTLLGPIKHSTESKRLDWLKKVERLGADA